MNKIMQSIKSKITLIVVLIVSAGFLGFMGFDYTQFKTNALVELEELAQRKAHRLALNLALPLWEVDNKWIEDTILTEMHDKQVYAVSIYTEDNLLITKARDTLWQVVDSTGIIEGAFIVHSQNIMHDSEKIGEAKIYVSSKFVDELLKQRVQREIIALSIVALMIVFLLMLLLDNMVIQRLQSMLKASKAIEAGDYEHEVNVAQMDEIGLLGQGMNTMKASIQKREADIIESESRFRSLVNNAADAFYLVDMNGRIVDVNKVSSAMLGYSRDELLQMGVAEVQVGLPIEKVLEVINSMPIGSSKTLFGQHRKKDGTTFPIEAHISVIEQREQRYSITLVSDITERRNAEEKIRLYSQAMEQSGEAIVITDADGAIEHINPAFCQITEYEEHEVLGKTPRILKSGNQNNAFYRHMWKTVLDGKVWQGKIINKKKSGEFYPAMLTISPIKDIGGNITHFIGIEQDLKAFELLEEQFYQSQKMEAIGTLVGGIAHDFNNTLAGITGNIYLAKKSAKDLPDVLERLNNINTLSFGAAATIQQLLAFSRKGLVEMHNLSISSFLKETVKLQQVSLPENINLSVEIMDSDLHVKGDINQLQQVLMNLINNAFDALESADKPEIFIELSRYSPNELFLDQHEGAEAKDYARITVTDNGQGITPKNLDHIFEPFFTSKEQGKGTGLGLSMVLGAIQTHEGFIDVTSSTKPPTGTSFQIYLPLVLEGEVVDIEDFEDEVILGHKETILLVDDNTIVLEAAVDVLQELGYQVLTATDGVKAIEIYQEHQAEIDLLIFDVVMPTLGGPAALKVIKEINPEVKAIFATGYDKLSSQGLKREEISEPIISKPFKINILSQVIHDALHGK